jgi:hypothetical protein
MMQALGLSPSGSASLERGMPSDDYRLADDLLRGAEAIADFIGLDTRDCFFHLQRGTIPAFKEGRTWVTTKSRLRRHYNESRFEPPPKPLAEAQPDVVVVEPAMRQRKRAASKAA